MPCLVQNASDGSVLQQWDIHDQPLTVGRGDKASAKIDDQEMSRLHFVIAPQSGGGYVLKNYSSLNGTWLNGKLVQEETTIKTNDRIRAGKTHFTFDDGLSTAIRQLEKEPKRYSSFMRDLKRKHGE